MYLKGGFNFVTEYKIPKEITETGIYYVIITLESFKVTDEGRKFISKYDSKEVYTNLDREKDVIKLLKKTPLISEQINKKLSRTNVLKVTISIISYLGEIQKPKTKNECLKKLEILEENIKTTLTLSPPITNFVLMSSHRCMSLEDL